MPKLIERATRIQAAGNKPKSIDEVIGRVNSGHEKISVAIMQSPPGWQEPGQRPDFDEYTLVLEGVIHVDYEDGYMDAHSGQAIHAKAGEWVRYSTPNGARYVAICTPAFSTDSVHRDQD
jgi:ethanolamine utilization protein EutQ (cupin superfamily)